MKVLNTGEELRVALAPLRAQGKTIGFVPTMGALHEGHASLLRRSVSEGHVTVLSIFVNPTQFGPNEDFSRYPRTFEADCALAEREGVAFVFAPAPEDIYPPGWSTFIEVEKVSEPLCGKFRPGHFRGVATVVYRLFRVVEPSVAYFGLKDLQQCQVIQRMVRDLGLSLRLDFVPTLREPDGLAMSSRNRYLSTQEREKALVIFRAMEAVRVAFESGEREVSALLLVADRIFSGTPDFQLQYREIRSLPDLGALERVEGPAAFAVAGFLGKTRLIDNLVF